MYVAATIIHSLRDKPCPSHIFMSGDFTAKEKKEIDKIFLAAGIKQQQFPNYNYWKIMKYNSHGVYAVRFTWDRGGIFGEPFKEFEKELLDYQKGD